VFELLQRMIPQPVFEGEGAGYAPPPADDKGSGGDIPEGFPEKFLKEGKPDFASLINSYSELEKWKGGKTDELKTQWEQERLASRPEAPDKYQTPDIEQLDKAEFEKHPLAQWWKETAFAQGMSQEQFEQGVKDFADKMMPPIDEAAEKKKLGDNADARLAAVAAFADKYKDKPEQQMLLMQLTQVAEGVKLIESLMGTGKVDPTGDPVPPPSGPTLEELKEMQKDRRYWDPMHRDMSFVKKIEDGYAALYPKKQAS